MKHLKLIMTILWTVLLIMIIVGVGGYLILIANGYKINPQAKKIVQTGMIYIKSDPKQANVYLNDDLKASKTPVKLSDLENGRYDVTVKKDTYQDWQKTLAVENGLVNSEDSIVLFLATPVEANISQAEIDAFAKNQTASTKDNLEIRSNSEIWIKAGNPDGTDRLVTRLSSPVINAVYYNDNKHIVYQIKDEIRVMDLDGSNNLLLITLPAKDPAEFYIDSSGADLLYSQNSVNKKLRIH